ncbi:MAG: hypothetical protein K0S65_5861, partial [Labilithrix sp.]|nr:hypothetical protein [Labilithrix sp.]
PTRPPGTGISFNDVMPLENRAFSTITSQYLGRRVAEWTPDGGWTLLTRVDQSSWPIVFGEGALWAPDEDTVYFSIYDNTAIYASIADLLGLTVTYGAIVVRGRRPVAPATEWTWTQSRIPCDWWGGEAGIGGTKDGNVYVATCGKIFRLDTSADAGAASDGGADAGAETLRWVDDGFVDADPTIPIAFYEIGGTGPDDLWFAGGRLLNGSEDTSCALVVHKTTDGYRTVIDGIPQSSGCVPRGNLSMVQGTLSAGIHAFSKNRLITVVPYARTSGKSAAQLVNVAHFGDQITVQTAEPPVSAQSLLSPWAASEDDLVVIGSDNSGDGNFILRGRSLWGNNPSWGFSQLAINGLRNPAGLGRLRGTSTQNLWTVGGNGIAYHKSTP